MINPLDRLKPLLTQVAGQKRLFVWVLKYGALLVVFLAFFIPTQQELSVISANMNSVKQQTEDLKKISVNLMTPQEIEETEQHLKEFETKLIDVSKTSKLLDFFSEEAEKNHLNVIQIYSDSPVAIKDEAGKDLEFIGKKLMWLPVNFRVETDYKNLGNYLKSLKDNVKGSFLMESLQVQKTSSPSGNLQCDITLSFVAV